MRIFQRQIQAAHGWAAFLSWHGCTPDMHPNALGCKQTCQVYVNRDVNNPVYTEFETIEAFCKRRKHNAEMTS